MKGDHIKYRKGYKYQLVENYTVFVGILPLRPVATDWIVLQPNGWLTIFRGYAWDGPSGPTFDTSSSMRGSLIHDALYQLMRLGLLDECHRVKADQLLRAVCIEDGMPPFRVEIWEGMVSLFAAGCAARGSEPDVLTAP